MTDTVEDLKRQLQQLQSLADEGVLSPEAAGPARAELERRLVAAVMAAPVASVAAGALAATPLASGAARPAPAETAGAASAVLAGEAPARPSPRLLLGLGAGVLALALAGYAWRGNWEGWRANPGAPAAGATPEAGAGAGHTTANGQIEAMVAALAERLKAQPDDAQGWLMLGRSYAVLGRHAEAIPAYRKALALNPQEAQAMADLADALAVGNAGRFEGEPTRLIEAALKAEPDNLKARALAGTLAFERQDYAGAVRHWEVVVRRGNPDSGLVTQMRAGLAEARQLAGLPPEPDAPAQPGEPAQPAPPGPMGAGSGRPTEGQANAGGAAQAGRPANAGAATAAPAQARISGRVELAPALAGKVKPDDVVFILARPAQGSRMPLALLQKRVRDLPTDYTLDDSLAMSPAAKLSGAAQVVVVARVSRSGQAMPQPGDLQGQIAAPVAPGATGVRIVINEEVR